MHEMVHQTGRSALCHWHDERCIHGSGRYHFQSWRASGHWARASGRHCPCPGPVHRAAACSGRRDCSTTSSQVLHVRPVHGLDRGGLRNLDCPLALPPPRHRSDGPARKRSRRGGRQPRPWHAREKAEPWRRDSISKDWLISSGSSLPRGRTHQLSVVFEPGFEPTSTSL